MRRIRIGKEIAMSLPGEHHKLCIRNSLGQISDELRWLMSLVTLRSSSPTKISVGTRISLRRPVGIVTLARDQMA